MTATRERDTSDDDGAGSTPTRADVGWPPTPRPVAIVRGARHRLRRRAVVVSLALVAFLLVMRGRP